LSQSRRRSFGKKSAEFIVVFLLGIFVIFYYVMRTVAALLDQFVYFIKGLNLLEMTSYLILLSMAPFIWSKLVKRRRQKREEAGEREEEIQKIT
jgi:hypothetical protein